MEEDVLTLPTIQEAIKLNLLLKLNKEVFLISSFEFYG